MLEEHGLPLVDGSRVTQHGAPEWRRPPLFDRGAVDLGEPCTLHERYRVEVSIGNGVGEVGAGEEEVEHAPIVPRRQFLSPREG